MGMADRAIGYLPGSAKKAAEQIKADRERKAKALERIQRETNPGAYKKK